jgi:crotonobetainyl-CoA:carnitine CoA-transferase CaiB-like acyl-CoA transferase
MLDFLPAEYDQLGVVRGRAGNLSDYSAPSNVYRSKDGVWITIPASSQAIFQRLCVAIGKNDLPQDERFKTNVDRLRHRETLDQIVASAIAERTLVELRIALDQNEVGWSSVNSIADVFTDPHFLAREMIVQVPDSELGSIKMQNVVPRYSHSQGRVVSTGPSLGEHNEEIYCRWLGLSGEELDRLKAAEVI